MGFLSDLLAESATGKSQISGFALVLGWYVKFTFADMYAHMHPACTVT